MDFGFTFDKLIIQPTTLCNLNCQYCYLSGRGKKNNITKEITLKIAQDLFGVIKKPVTLIWHGGEPLSCGLAHFKEIIAPFEELEKQNLITHAIQTNATLIDEDWCDFFKLHNFHIGVSIDGPVLMNSKRFNWNGAFAFDKIMEGINLLKRRSLRFYAIAVVSDSNLKQANDFYKFFSELGCYSLAINIEEKEGANKNGGGFNKDELMCFWSDLYHSWRANPVIEIREISRVIGWVTALCFKESLLSNQEQKIDVLPTIGWDGKVVLLSPELLGANSREYADFVVGNIKDKNLIEIINNANDVSYVKDFLKGISLCEASCQYYSFCRGGYASNKYYELGTLIATQTESCLHAKQYLVDAVINEI